MIGRNEPTRPHGTRGQLIAMLAYVIKAYVIKNVWENNPAEYPETRQTYFIFIKLNQFWTDRVPSMYCRYGAKRLN